MQRARSETGDGTAGYNRKNMECNLRVNIQLLLLQREREKEKEREREKGIGGGREREREKGIGGGRERELGFEIRKLKMIVMARAGKSRQQAHMEAENC